VVCTDLRTRAELERARALGASLWLVVRPGAGAPGDLARHQTERALAEWPEDRFDRVLRNEGTLADLCAAVDSAL
jgi:hypothetical protein